MSSNNTTTVSGKPIRRFGMNTVPSNEGGNGGAKYTFTLNVAYTDLDKMLGCAPVAKNFSIIPPKNTTKIEDIFGGGTNTSSCTFAFLDPSKKNKRWVLTMKDAIKQIALPPELSTPVKCWWCHDSFTAHPLGCPLKLVRNTTESTYYSHSNKKDMPLYSGSDSGSGGKDGYYLTKGYLCCWECLLAYGESVKSQSEFRECVQLIYHMFKEAGGEGTINPAPHYTLKQEYGGPLTPQEYKTHHETYQMTGNAYIRMVPMGELFEVTSKF